MSQAGVSLIWCMIQVTLIGLVTGILYAAVRRVRPGAALPVVLAGLLTVVVLTTLAFSPWPRWALRPENAAVEISNRLDTSAATDTAVSQTGPPFSTVGQAQAAVDGAGAGSYWETLLEELSRSTIPAQSSGWSWTAAVTVAFLFIGGTAVLWFVAGTVAVRGYRRRSRPIQSPALLEQIDVLRAELECSKRVELRETDELVTAATVGWRRPVILLPKAWRDWTAPQRRAVLAHELAHIRAGDYPAMILGQLGLVLHFYHPLVHWLLGRLRLEQELAADAVAASVSGGQREYLKAIAELALRQPHRPMAWPARSFLPTRTTFLRRISMLRDSKLSLEKPSGPLRLLPIALILAFGFLISGLRGPASDRPALAGPAEESRPTANEGGEQPSVDGGFDLSYVPKENVWLLVVFRPAAIFGRPEFKEIGDLLGGVGGPARFRNLPLEKLEQVTCVVLDPFAASTGGQLAPMNMPTIILRASQPHDFRKFIATMGDSSTHEHKGRTYHLWKRRPAQEGGYYLLDERTLVMGAQSNLKTLIDGRSQGLPDYIDADTWQKFQGDHLLVAASSAVPEAIINSTANNSLTFQQTAAIFSPFAPLWESTSSVILGARLDDRIRVHGVAFSDDRQETKKVKQTLDALVVLSRNTAERGGEVIRESESAETKLLAIALDTATRLLDAVTVQREGKTVRLATSAPIGSADSDWMGQIVEAAQQASTRSQSVNNMKQIGIGMHNFYYTYKRFPPAAARTSKTRQPMKDNPPHSWRVAILPFVEEADLYDQYRFDEPWDSPQNLKVLQKIPAVYRHPNDPPGTIDTGYFAMVGSETVFSGEEGARFRDIRDGTSITLMIVEAKRPVPWTKPEDIPYDPEKPIPELGGYFEGGFHAATCDAAVHLLSDSIDETLLRGLISKAGGEVVRIPQ